MSSTVQVGDRSSREELTCSFQVGPPEGVFLLRPVGLGWFSFCRVAVGGGRAADHGVNVPVAAGGAWLLLLSLVLIR